MEKKRNGNIIPIIIFVFIVFLAILASVAFIYHENQIDQLQSKIFDLELAREEEKALETSNEEGNKEWDGKKTLIDSNYTYFDPNGMTYHSSPDCPLAKKADELTRMIYSKFSDTSGTIWRYKTIEGRIVSGIDVFFPCALCVA